MNTDSAVTPLCLPGLLSLSSSQSFTSLLADGCTTRTIRFDLEPLSSIECYQFPPFCLCNSFWVFLLLIFLFWVSILMLSSPLPPPPPLVLLILATCPVHCPLMHRTLSIISFTPVLDLITSFRILSLFVMFNNDHSMLRWVTASFFS